MDIVKILEELYGADEPIFLNETRAAMIEYSSQYIFKCIRKAIKEEKLICYVKSIYYIPTESFFGKSLLSASKVIEKSTLRKTAIQLGFIRGLDY